MSPLIFDLPMSAIVVCPKQKLLGRKIEKKTGNSLQIPSWSEFFSVRIEDCVSLTPSLRKEIFHGGRQNTEPVSYASAESD